MVGVTVSIASIPQAFTNDHAAVMHDAMMTRYNTWPGLFMAWSITRGHHHILTRLPLASFGAAMATLTNLAPRRHIHYWQTDDAPVQEEPWSMADIAAAIGDVASLQLLAHATSLPVTSSSSSSSSPLYVHMPASGQLLHALSSLQMNYKFGALRMMAHMTTAAAAATASVSSPAFQRRLLCESLNVTHLYPSSVFASSIPLTTLALAVYHRRFPIVQWLTSQYGNIDDDNVAPLVATDDTSSSSSHGLSLVVTRFPTLDRIRYLRALLRCDSSHNDLLRAVHDVTASSAPLAEPALVDAWVWHALDEHRLAFMMASHRSTSPSIPDANDKLTAVVSTSSSDGDKYSLSSFFSDPFFDRNLIPAIWAFAGILPVDARSTFVDVFPEY